MLEGIICESEIDKSPKFSKILLAIIHNSHISQVSLKYCIHICGEIEKLKPCYLSQSCFNLVNIFGLYAFVDESYLSFIYIQPLFQGQKSLQKSNEATVIKYHQEDFKWHQDFKDVMVFGDLLLRKWHVYNPVFLSIITGSEQRQACILTDYM